MNDNNTEIKPNKMAERMVSYINDKYDDNFTYIGPCGGYLGSSIHKIFVSSEKFPNRDVTVICNLIDGKELYSDNYIGVKFENKTKELIRKTLVSCFGNSVFLCYAVDLTASYKDSNDDTTFEDYIGDPSSAINFTAIIEYNYSDNSINEISEKLRNALSDAGLCCGGMLYFGNNIVQLADLTDENYYEVYVNKNEYWANLYFSMLTKDGFDIEKWEEK